MGQTLTILLNNVHGSKRCRLRKPNRIYQTDTRRGNWNTMDYWCPRMSGQLRSLRPKFPNIPDQRKSQLKNDHCRKSALLTTKFQLRKRSYRAQASKYLTFSVNSTGKQLYTFIARSISFRVQSLITMTHVSAEGTQIN